MLVEAFGPLYQSFICKDGKIELHFYYAEEGFIIKGEASGFEVAGDDMAFVPALVELTDSRIIVSSPEIKTPLAARYCWTSFGDVSVFGKNGLPIAPFRTYRK